MNRRRDYPDNRQLKPGLAERALRLIRERYADFAVFRADHGSDSDIASDARHGNVSSERCSGSTFQPERVRLQSPVSGFIPGVLFSTSDIKSAVAFLISYSVPPDSGSRIRCCSAVAGLPSSQACQNRHSSLRWSADVPVGSTTGPAKHMLAPLLSQGEPAHKENTGRPG